MLCDEAQELITAELDGELAAHEAVALESHLKGCELCRAARAAESRLKQQLKRAGRSIAAPAPLRDVVEATISKGRESAQPGRRSRQWLGPWSWRPALAAALVVFALAGIIYTRWPEQSIGFAALSTHASILSGKTLLAPADDPKSLREQLARAVGGRFEPVALDLSMMKLYPVSGFVQRIGDRDVLVTVYQGDAPAVTCFTFLGSEADAPSGSELFYDSDMRINFYSFASGGVNGLLHREGEVICILVSRMPAAELLALIRGKSAHA
jgi:hypothetical protein